MAKLKENIISTKHVPDWLDCGMSCLETRFCIAFSHKKISDKKEINCQLSHTITHEFRKPNTKKDDWVFYAAMGDKIVRTQLINANI